ncbi:hypothetical protein ACLOAV_005849 [Pseudogymnoascus australis]
MSTISNGSVTSKSSKQKFSAQLKELLLSAKKVLGNERDIDTLDRILDDKKELEAKLMSKISEVEAKDKQIANKDLQIEKLYTVKKTLHDEFQEQFKSWDTGASRQKELEAETAQLRGRLGEETRRADSAKSKNAELQKVILKCQNDVGDMKDELNRTSKDLRSKERELSGALSELDSLQEEKNALGLQVLDHHELSAKFGGFIQSCHKLAKGFFFTQFPDSVTYDDLQSRLYQSGFTKLAPKSIPISNSLPSQFLRMAAAEKIIAQKLCTNIFRQYYLPETLADRQAMDSVLERLFGVNSRDEAVFRLQLLAAYKSEENRHVTSVVKSTIQEVVAVLGLLISPDLQGDFQSKLGKLLQEAVKLWSPVQRSAVRACVDNEPEQDWDSFKDYDGLVDSTPDQMKQVLIAPNPIDSLFPRISIGDDIICQGYALWSSQNMVIAAGLDLGTSKAYASAKALNNNIDDFCQEVTNNEPVITIGWTWSKIYYRNTPEEYTMTVAISNRAFSSYENQCIDAMRSIINGCDVPVNGSNPMNWNQGGKRLHGDYTYKIDIFRQNRPWPPPTKPRQACEG